MSYCCRVSHYDIEISSHIIILVHIMTYKHCFHIMTSTRCTAPKEVRFPAFSRPLCLGRGFTVRGLGLGLGLGLRLGIRLDFGLRLELGLGFGVLG